MLKLKDSTVKNTAELLEKAITVARSFGFSDLHKQLDALPSKRLKAAEKVVHVHKSERALLPTMRKIASRSLTESQSHILGYEIDDKSPKESCTNFSLNIIGSENPIAEATLIATAYTLLSDIGINDATVHINSLGTAESFTRYMRDLSKYLKKISKQTPLQVRADLTISPLRAYARLCNADAELSEKCPKAIDYLNDEGRSHLWGLLEYLEDSGIPYVLDNSVVGSGDFYEQTLFELRSPNATIAHGGRYSPLARKAFKKHIPATCMHISIPHSGARKLKNTNRSKGQSDNTFYFAQLGLNAKKLGLKLLRTLHEAGIYVRHSFTEGELTKQMSHHNVKDVPFVIIIGQKEALEDSVIVRDTATHKQKIVPANKLVQHLKKLQK